MAGTLNGYFNDQSVNADAPRTPSTYVANRVLAGASEQITIPTGAIYARVSVSATMTIAFGANPTAIAIADEDTGAGSEQITPNEAEWYYVAGLAKIALFGTGNASISFYKN